MRVFAGLLVLIYLSVGDCGVVSSPSSPKDIPAASPTQAEGTTPSPAAAAVTEVPEELTTIIEIEESAEAGNSSEQVDFVNLPGYGVVDDANSTANASIFSCYNRRYGYYADMAKKCYMFHLCYPVQEPTTGSLIFQRFSFVCSDNAVFDQQHLVCVDNDTLSYPCSESHNYFTESNNKLIESMQQNAQAYSQQNAQVQQQAAAGGESGAQAAAEALVAEPVTAEAGEVPTAANATSSTDADAAAQYALLEQLFG